MRSRGVRTIGAALAAVPLLMEVARSAAPPQAMPATLVSVTHNARTVSYPVRDGAGNLIRNASYRVTDAGGNCCEVLVTSTASGQLLELGGGYPFLSSDKGQVWQRVSPQIGNNGEGSVVPAPNGDIVGMTWGIDRVTTYKYEAATGQWHAAEGALHTPFFDRPWLTLAKGPFPIPGGGTAPYLTIMHGGWPTRRIEFVSYDGLTYVQASDPSTDAAVNARTSGPLTVAADPDLDYLQPPFRAQTAPLPGFGAIRGGSICSGGLAVLRSDTRWACRTLPGGAVGTTHVDSKGWLHEVTTSGRSLAYRVSTDGGATWRRTTTPLPGSATASFTGTTLDFKSHGATLTTAVAVRAQIGGTGQQDLVFVYGYPAGAPALKEIHYIGRGDLNVGSSLGANPRLDFSTVAIMPDGKVVSSLFDTTVGQPALAVEL